MATFIEDLGIVSAYGEAVRKGYTGTEEEFAEMLANLPDKLAEAREYAASAAESSASAASSADGVQRNASIASTAASDAQSAAASALQSATFAETTVDGIEEHEEQCRIYRAEAVAAAEELKTTTLWNDALIDETVTGKIASFSDGCVGMPMKSIVAEITPVQSGSGEPSPTNIRPISGRTGMTVTRAGKNLLPSHAVGSTTVYGVTFDVREDGSIRVHGTATQQADFPIVPQNKLTLSPGTYTVKRTPGDNIQYVIGGASNTSGLAYTVVSKDNDATFTISNRGTTGHNILRVLSGATVDAVCYPQIEVGSTATAYEPYTGTTIPITWQTEAGTVYGGTLDVVSGVLTVDRAIAEFDGSSDETWRALTTPNIFRYDDLNPAILAEKRIQSITNETKVTPYSYETMKNNYPSIAFNESGLLYLAISDDITTAAQCKEWLAANPLQVCYYIATPQTYQLTATEVRTILGENLVYSDANDVTVNYYVDMKGYIDKRLNTTRMMIAGVETSFVATKNYAIGDFVIVNDTLYRITAVITSGETITPGTNASETTVAEQLIALYNA